MNRRIREFAEECRAGAHHMIVRTYITRLIVDATITGIDSSLLHEIATATHSSRLVFPMGEPIDLSDRDNQSRALYIVTQEDEPEWNAHGGDIVFTQDFDEMAAHLLFGTIARP